MTSNCVRLLSQFLAKSAGVKSAGAKIQTHHPAARFSSAAVVSQSSPGDASSVPFVASPTTGFSQPIFPQRHLPFLRSDEPPIQCWLETLRRAPGDAGDESLVERVGFVSLHPHIFAYSVRTDLLWDNVQWQKLYRQVNWEHQEDRYERKGGGAKPWKQKGTGRARQSSIRAPHWKGGGVHGGKRAPTSFYYELPKQDRVDGLRGVLTYKYLQGDLHIVDKLDLEKDVPEDLEALAVERGWGVSCLMINEDDRISPNLAVATSQLCNFNVMPVYGFNVYSALKHDTLVISLAALDVLESKLLTAINANEIIYPRNPPMAWPDPAINGQFKFKTYEDQDWDIEDRHLQMPFTPKGDGHIDVETEEGGVKKKKRVQDPIPPRHRNKWHQRGEEGRWVYQYDDIESEQGL